MTASHQSVFLALMNLLGMVVVRTGLLLRGILLAGLFVAAVQAEGISINKAEMRHGEEGY